MPEYTLPEMKDRRSSANASAVSTASRRPAAKQNIRPI